MHSKGLTWHKNQVTLFVLCAGDQPVVPKKKITESAAEPDHVEIYLSTRTIDLYLSAVVDFCQCELRERAVHFHDTLMFQTRTYRYYHCMFFADISHGYLWENTGKVEYICFCLLYTSDAADE